MSEIQQCQTEIRRLRNCVGSWNRTIEAMQKLERLEFSEFVHNEPPLFL